MAPKEKAKELIEMFEGELVTPPTYGTPKGCAFICVKNILAELNDLYSNANVSDSSEIEVTKKIDYWVDVKRAVLEHT
jgi:hypothetical protein